MQLKRLRQSMFEVDSYFSQYAIINIIHNIPHYSLQIHVNTNWKYIERNVCSLSDYKCISKVHDQLMDLYKFIIWLFVLW